MDTAAFLIEISKRAGPPLDVPDPLAFAEAFLAESGDTAEGQTLRRAIDAIAFDWGSLNESDIWRLSRRSLQLVSALCEARLSGQYLPLEWARVR